MHESLNGIVLLCMMHLLEGVVNDIKPAQLSVA